MHIKDLLEIKYNEYCRIDFIENDPISIPHKYSKKEDIEIAGFLTATISWGNRTSIISNANKLLNLMDNAPFDFLMNFQDADLKRFKDFKHRTFQPDDVLFFINSLRNIYLNSSGLESVFAQGFLDGRSIESSLIHFRKVFLEFPHIPRSRKHISDVGKNASAKRLNMFLRWMVRDDGRGVDFGIWDSIPKSALMIPLDVHVSTVAQKLGLLQRTQHDWKAVSQLTNTLRKFDPNDPVKYDFALFGMGVSGFGEI